MNFIYFPVLTRRIYFLSENEFNLDLFARRLVRIIQSIEDNRFVVDTVTLVDDFFGHVAKKFWFER